MNNDSFRPTARKEGLIVQELPDELLVFDTHSKTASCLNASAAFIWNQCDGSREIREIVAEFRAQGRGAVTDGFVWLGIEQLRTSGLLIEGGGRGSDLRRRDLIRKAALASAVTLPIVGSLSAPISALAGASCACTTNAICNQAPYSTTCQGPICDHNGFCGPVV